MQTLSISNLESITGGGSGDWDALLSTGAVAAGSLAFLVSAPASIPAALGGVALFNLGIIGSGVSLANILHK